MMRNVFGCLLLAAVVSCSRRAGDFQATGVKCGATHCTCVSNDGRVLGYVTPIRESEDKYCECAIEKDAYEQTGMVGKTFDCDEKGNYSPVRCLGSVCSCVDVHGRDLGYATHIAESSDKNCQCAVEKDAYQQTGMIGKTFNCDEKGNYSPVRCLGSVCSCVDSYGRDLGYATPIGESASKNCKCAIEKDAYQQTGLIGLTFNCDEQGNYSPVHCVGSVCSCVDAHGRDLGYATPIGQLANKNCECAVAKDAYEQTGMIGLTYSCDEQGNYSPVSCLGSVCSCVDAHGRDLGYATPIGQSANKNCKCAVEKDAYKQTGMLGRTFMCDALGNYKSLQCTGSVCYCRDENGQQIGEGVHISQMNSLNC